LSLMLWGTVSTLAADDISLKDGVKLIYEFNGVDATVGWGKTEQMTIVPRVDNLELNGNGWDAKIYRSINLPAGYYLVTACGKGESIQVQIAKDWNMSSLLFDLNLSQTDRRTDWRTDWRPFQLEKPMKLLLIVRASAAEPVVSAIKSIRIEQAQEVVEPGTPSVAELEKQRPQPVIVRGCTCPGYQGFPDLHVWGANVVRNWIGLKPERYAADGLAEYGSGWEKQLDKLETYLQAARDARMKVVLTLSGGVFANGKCWDNPGLSAVVSKVWRGIAERLLPYRDVIYGYDLYNEPLDWAQMPNAPRQWRDIAKNAIKAIREVDKETWIIYQTGPGGLCWGFAGMKPLPDSRIIYSVHFYSPHEFTHQGIYNIKGTDLSEIKAKTGIRYPGVVNGLSWNKERIKKDLEPARQFQLKYHVPIVVGEFSVVRWAPKADAVQYLTDLIDIFEEYQWSWIYHSFRECNVWSVEHDEAFGRVEDSPPPSPVETERAKIIKSGLARNRE